MTLFRSWLFVPGNIERRMNKMKQLHADVIVMDLEDSVPIAEKGNARQAASRALMEPGSRTLYVRVNDAASGWLADDLFAIVQPQLKGIMLPKVSRSIEIIQADQMLTQLEQNHGIAVGSIDVVPLIETAEGVYRAFELASCCSRVRRLAFGSVDYTLDLNVELSDEGLELLYPRSQLVVHSRAAGIEAPIDAAYMHIKDESGLRRDTRLAKQLGFQGKLIIHPDQIHAVNDVFTPSLKEIEVAQEVIAAYRLSESEGRAAIQVNGKMVDLPVVQRYVKLLKAASELGLIQEA